jgi:glycosyltransferase involved in cell wall biosynthesis
MRILMFTWEFPPYISGGLGIACYGIVRSLLKKGIEVDLVLPTEEELYFPLRQVNDIDTMPVRFIEEERQIEFAKRQFLSLQEKLAYLKVQAVPDSYQSPPAEIAHRKWEELIAEAESEETKSVLKTIHFYLDKSHETLFKKVYEMSLRAAKLASILSFDMIHCHDWLTAPAGVATKMISKKPLVMHVHATEFDRAGGVGHEHIHKIEYAGMKAADVVIPVSNYTANMIMSRYNVEAEKIKVVHDALDMTQEDSNTPKKKLFRRPTILFLGRITIQKGPDYFMEVAKQVIAKYPDIRFIMAGAGDMMKKMIHTSAYYKFKNNFLFTGFLNKQQVIEIFKTSDIFIMPSISEPFGIAPLEAMGYGVVTIISKQSGVAEVIENVFKIDFWDIKEMVKTIIYLLDNPQDRERIAKAGQREVANIQWDEAVDKIISIYKEMEC